MNSCDAGEVDLDARVTQVVASKDSLVSELLAADPLPESDFHLEQRKDVKLQQICGYLENGLLPELSEDIKKIISQSMYFQIIDHVLYFIDPRKRNCRRVAVPKHLQQQILYENHGGVMAGHFSGARLYEIVSRKWWWEDLYKDAISFCKNCPECAVVSGTGRRQKPPLHPLQVGRPF